MSMFHGSDVEKVAAQFQVDADKLVNFGVNANPLGLSPKAVEAIRQNTDILTRYPDPTYHSLKIALANYLQTEPERILPSNGTSELIHRIVRTFSPKRALLFSPTYSEYAEEVTRNGGEVIPLILEESSDFAFPVQKCMELLAGSKPDLVLFCNPNNPTGTLIPQEALIRLLDETKRCQIPMIIDETYIEFVADNQPKSLVPLLPNYPHLIILRGFSKFFAAPGLRLGYGIFGNPALIESLSEGYPWSISSLSAFAGEVILSDENYRLKSEQFITKERTRILNFLANLEGLTVYPCYANFFFVKLHHHSSHSLFLYLLKKELMIRSFYEEAGEGFFRFCIMTEDDNTRLLNAIAEFLNSAPSL